MSLFVKIFSIIRKQLYLRNVYLVYWCRFCYWVVVYFVWVFFWGDYCCFLGCCCCYCCCCCCCCCVCVCVPYTKKSSMFSTNLLYNTIQSETIVLFNMIYMTCNRTGVTVRSPLYWLWSCFCRTPGPSCLPPLTASPVLSPSSCRWTIAAPGPSCVGRSSLWGNQNRYFVPNSQLISFHFHTFLHNL